MELKFLKNLLKIQQSEFELIEIDDSNRLLKLFYFNYICRLNIHILVKLAIVSHLNSNRRNILTSNYNYAKDKLCFQHEHLES